MTERAECSHCFRQDSLHGCRNALTAQAVKPVWGRRAPHWIWLVGDGRIAVHEVFERVDTIADTPAPA